MIYRLLADVVLLIHAGFVLFVMSGGFLALRWRRLALLHIPAAVWGVLIEYSGWICPLTPLENSLRARGGETIYHGGFVDHYVTSFLYPTGLTRNVQLILGTIALLVNVVAYGLLLNKIRKGRR
jgi:hypothetical protein